MGNNYNIADGNTDYKYVWWAPATSTTNLVGSNTFPTLTANDCLLFLNKNGVAVLVPTSTILDGALIVPESILANAIAANTITADQIATGAITANELAANCVTANAISANAIGAAAIAAGAIQTDHLAASAVTADKILIQDLVAATAFIEALKVRGIDIGSGSSTVMKFETKLDGSGNPYGQISFVDGETVAYINNQLMYIRNAQILEALRFGVASLVTTDTGFLIR